MTDENGMQFVDVEITEAMHEVHMRQSVYRKIIEHEARMSKTKQIGLSGLLSRFCKYMELLLPSMAATIEHAHRNYRTKKTLKAAMRFAALSGDYNLDPIERASYHMAAQVMARIMSENASDKQHIPVEYEIMAIGLDEYNRVVQSARENAPLMFEGDSCDCPACASKRVIEAEGGGEALEALNQHIKAITKERSGNNYEEEEYNKRAPKRTVH